MQPQIEIQMIAVLIAAACALPGQFLVLRKMAMVSDSITHTILLGIVLGFFLTHDLSSPVLIAGAALTGVLTVWMTETVEKTKLVSEDTAVGIVFPLLFSIAVILISKYAGAIHLDTDAVLLGELAFAPFDRMVIMGIDVGAKGIYVAGIILLMNITAVIFFFKELKLAAFDPIMASVIGFSPVLLHYGIMGLVSVTAVGAFQSVGSILTVAFMVGPPVTAYLLTDDLKKMLIISMGIGMISGIAGYQISTLFDVSIAGCMAMVTGLVFILAFFCSPKYGMVTALWRKKNQKTIFAQYTFMLHLYYHAGTTGEEEENGIRSVCGHLNWKPGYLRKIAGKLARKGFIIAGQEQYQLTSAGTEASLAFEREIFE